MDNHAAGNLDQTLASMQEKVYACEVSQADATKMMKKFKVSNMKSERGNGGIAYYCR